MQRVQDKIKQIKNDIKSIKIQGATNVALAVLDAIVLVTKEDISSIDKFIEEVERVGIQLSEIRENEPLAENGVRYILSKLRKYSDLEEAKREVAKSVEEYTELVHTTRDKIAKYGLKELSHAQVILTHCHSSASTKTLIELYRKNPDLKIVSTETRPLFQGRLTAKELIDANVDVTQIVDSAAPSFIEDDRYLPVDSVLVGADEVLADGGFINKVGTYSMALAAKEGKDDFYVATTLLKVNLEKSVKHPEIEMRSARELWAEAPSHLQIINPAFDYVPAKFVTAFITEAGIVKPSEIKEVTLELYPWIKY